MTTVGSGEKRYCLAQIRRLPKDVKYHVFCLHREPQTFTKEELETCLTQNGKEMDMIVQLFKSGRRSGEEKVNFFVTGG